MASLTRAALKIALASVGFAVASASAEARVVRFVVEQRRAFADGKSFGTARQFERLDGTVTIEVDPRDPLDAIIANLDRAPRNARGRVEFSAPFYIIKPVDMSRGNHKLFYGINNRGNNLELAWRTILAPRGPNGNNDPLTAADAGDGLLFRLGYAFVDAGWQGNVAPGNHRLIPNLPVATKPDGSPLVGMIRVEYHDRSIPEAGTFTMDLEGEANFVSYPAADTNTSHSSLNVRDTVNGPKTTIPPDKWAFGTCVTGRASLMPNATNICLFDGFKVDRIYELIYPATNPWVMGLGYAVTRDVASFLRYEAKDDAGSPNPLAMDQASVGIRHAYAGGSSSTGMYLRDWLYLGFNEDEAHRKVFDAVQITIPGTHRLLANVEFSDPNTYNRQDVWHDSLSMSYPPLSFAVTTDPISGIRDGILRRPATDPLVFQVDSGTEFWQMQASLNVRDGRGAPISIPDNVRLYFASSYQHGGGAGLLNPPSPAGLCQNERQGQGWAPTLRALLIDLDEWADRGIAPPSSNYPSVEAGTLVPLAAARAAFPMIPGVEVPTVVNELFLPNFGPHFSSAGGSISERPPAMGPHYQVLVPKPDADGLDIGGIRPMEIAAPTATLTGWNVRATGHRRPELCELNGSFIPLPKTKAERVKSGDPRPSLEERYGNHAGYVSAVKAAAEKLVNNRFLLKEDADRYVQAALASDVLK
jgi:hypothetical protein